MTALLRLVCRLRFRSGFRMGGLAGDVNRRQETVETSTLWGGLGCCAASLFGADAADALVTEGSLSSLLWAEGDRYFVPRPLSPVEPSAETDLKRFKKLRWIPLEELADFLAGNLPQGGRTSFGEEEVLTSAALDRTSNAAVPYARRRCRTNDAEGVILAELPPSHRRIFEAALHLFGDEGLGGERSSGWGHFDATVLPAEETPFGPFLAGASPGASRPGAGKEAFLALGCCLPTKEDLSRLENAAGDQPLGYDFVTLRGWVGASSVLKPTVTAFAAGSVFPFRPKGLVVEITPPDAPNRVTFNGCPVFLPLPGLVGTNTGAA